MRPASVKPAILPTQSDVVAPTSTTKRQAILNAAALEFLEKGYGAASMEAIAHAAKVSKQTIYAHFDGKDALFEAIIREKCEDLRIPAVFDRHRGEPVQVALQRIAETFLGRILGRENMRLFRILVSECGRFPELADAFYRAGPRLAADQLAKYLAEAEAAGELAVDDAEEAAEVFFAMLRGDIYMRRLMGIDHAMDEAEAASYARTVVRNFLSAYAN